MPSVFTENDDKEYVSLKQPGCVASWHQGTGIIETFYDAKTTTTTTTTRRTELKSASVNLQQALFRQNVATEHHILQNIMKGDRKMFKANKYAVQEYKRKSSIECMSGKENSPLPALARELIAATKDLKVDQCNISSNVDSVITIHVIVIDDGTGGALQPQQERYTFDVDISASSIGARLMDHCLTELKSLPNSRAKLSFDERGGMAIHRDHKLVDQGVRHNDHIFVQIDAHYDIKEWIDVLYISSGNEKATEATMKDLHFLKCYNGEHKIECAKAESIFFNALNEKEIHFKYECPYLVRPVLTVLDKSTNFAMSITPLFPEGDAFDIFSNARHVPFLAHKELYNNLGPGALKHLYRLGFQHGDVKLENVMYRIDEENHPRFYLTDCEFAGTPGLNVDRSSGTPNYSSPERFSSPPRADAKCDGWSFALTIIAAWCKCLLQVTSLDSKQEAGRCRVHIETCSVCKIALVLDSSGNNACVCNFRSSTNQPLIKQTIDNLIAICFERFSFEMGRDLDDCFPNIGGAEKACEIVQGTLNGLLTIEHDSRYGPDMVRVLG